MLTPEVLGEGTWLTDYLGCRVAVFPWTANLWVFFFFIILEIHFYLKSLLILDFLYYSYLKLILENRAYSGYTQK